VQRKEQDALVIGGGLVGLCCAIGLQRRGLATLLIDPQSTVRPASWGNAGHIAVEQVEPLASWPVIRNVWRHLFLRGGPVALPPREIGAWLPFALRFAGAARRFAPGKAALSSLVAGALPAWRALLSETGAPDLLVENGHMLVWESEAAARKGRAAWAKADTGEARFRDAAPEELALLPVPLAGGLRFEGTAQIADPTGLADALDAHFAALGGRRLRASADVLELEDGRAFVRAGGERISAGHVLVAAGTGARPLLERIGHKVPLIAERGYHIEAEAAWPEGLPPVVFEERSMIVTRFRSRLRAASFVEFARPEAPPDPRKWRRLRAHAAALRLPFGAEPKEWTGARPTLPDYLPALGRSRRASNLFYAFGHQHLGLTLSAVTGRHMAALIAGEAPEIDLSPFGLDRFGRRL
jgi:D-hydroxyproline dehydrogenase